MPAAVARPPHSATAQRPSNRSIALIVGGLTALLALPLGMALGAAWIDFAGNAPPARAVPQWVTPGTVRATTTDGTSVKARVALDVGTSDGRDAVQRRLQQVGLVLEVSVGAHGRRQLAGSRGIQNLSEDMLDRVNEYLDQEGVAPIRSVAIQDLLVGTN